MGTKLKKQQKLASDICVDDNIDVGGLLCTVTKCERIFHRTPEARVRLTLKIKVDETFTVDEIIVFVHHTTPIITYK